MSCRVDLPGNPPLSESTQSTLALTFLGEGFYFANKKVQKQMNGELAKSHGTV
jgi:hypothetical protein